LHGIDRASSDAELNLECAAEFALSDCAEVVLVGHADLNDDFCHVFRGTKVRKMHSSRRDAFKSVNCSPLARVRPGKIEFLNKFRARSSRAAELDTVFNDKVALVTFYPGQEPAILDYYFNEGYKGVVIQAVGLGHVAAGDAKHSWIGTIKRLVKEGFVICVAPQTIYGRLDSKIYSTGRELEKAGVVFLEDMLPETAFVKLGWALGHKNWKARDQIGDKMRENIAGELNEVITD
jgi:glutamyl-tRNA(Gln) amidotransferase subunit D